MSAWLKLVKATKKKYPNKSLGECMKIAKKIYHKK